MKTNIVIIIIALTTAVYGQFVTEIPCIGWDMDICKSSCFCGWCYNNTTGVCLSASKNSKCQQNLYTISQSDQCQKMYDQVSVALIIFLSVMATLVVGALLYGAYKLYEQNACERCARQ